MIKKDTLMSSPDIVLYMRAVFNGGTEVVMCNLADEFCKRGLKVEFLVDYHNVYSPLVGRLPPDANYVSLDAFGTIGRLRGLMRYLRRKKPGVLISAGYFPNIAAILATIWIRSSTRVIVTEHNSPTLNRVLSRWWESRKWFPYFARWLYPYADGIVAVSHGTAGDLSLEMRIPRDGITTIYNPVISAKIFESASEPLVDPWFQDDAIPVILALGRLEPQKNYLSLINAISMVQEVMRCRLVVIGVGSQREMLQSRIEELGLGESVRIQGFTDNPHKYTARASVMVLSSIWEGLSCVLVEALAFGTAITSTNCPFGPDEVLDGGRYGVLVPVDDDRALANGIIESLKCPRPRAPARWLEQFSVKVAADRYLSLAGIHAP